MLLDHLSNTRVTFCDANQNGTIEAGEVLQEAHYYPFGMLFTGLGTDLDTNRYLYNGKELQEGTDWYDFEARMYNAGLGRWFCADPLLQFHSPYVYSVNNPVRFIDPSGTFSFAFNQTSGGAPDDAFDSYFFWSDEKKEEYENSKEGGEGDDKTGSVNGEIKDDLGGEETQKSTRNFVELTTDLVSSNEFYFLSNISSLSMEYLGEGKVQNYVKLGSKYLGHGATIITGLTATKEVLEGDISPSRYGFRMTGTALSVLAASSSTGMGLLIGATFIGGEYAWDNHIIPFVEDVKFQFNMFQESLKPSNWIDY